MDLAGIHAKSDHMIKKCPCVLSTKLQRGHYNLKKKRIFLKLMNLSFYIYQNNRNFCLIVDRKVILKNMFWARCAPICTLYILISWVPSFDQSLSTVWQYGLWSFQTGGTKLERFLPKNQQTLGWLRLYTVLSNWKIDGRHKIFWLFRSKSL